MLEFKSKKNATERFKKRRPKINNYWTTYIHIVIFIMHSTSLRTKR